MSFPASQQLLVDALRHASAVANRTKQATTDLRALAVAGPVDRERLIDYLENIASAINSWNIVSAVSGIAQYAKAQYDDPALDIAAEFITMVAAAVDLRDWIFDNFPKDISGAWLVYTYNNQGENTTLQFSIAQLTGFVSRADTLINAIS